MTALLIIVDIAVWTVALSLLGMVVQALLVGEGLLNSDLSLRRRTFTGVVLAIETFGIFLGALCLTVWLSDIFDWVVVKCGLELIGPAGRASLVLSFILGPVIAYFVAKAIYSFTLNFANCKQAT